MRQMHMRATFGEHIGGPVPAVGGLQHHLRLLTPRSNLRRERERITVDAHHRTDPLTVWRHPHDHTAPLVQVYPDVLPAGILVHRGLPCRAGDVTIPGNPLIGVSVTGSGGPAPNRR